MTAVITKGSLFILSWGERGDYTIKGLCVANRDINIDDMIQRYKDNYPQQEEIHWFERSDKFCEWLIKEEKAATIIYCSEFQVGTYGDFDYTVINRI
jgi:hypothetical protein